MSNKTKPKEKRKLTRKQKKEINALVSSAKGDGKAHSAQDSIPYERMYEDGLCKLDRNHYSKCIEFEDINYQLAGNDDKAATFENLCDFYNYFDSSIAVQLSLISRFTNREEWAKVIEIADQQDDFNGIRKEYREMLQDQRSRGNNGLVKTKFLTVTVEAENEKAAKAKLSRIEADMLNHFKILGSSARVLKGKARLAVLHGMMHPEGEKFVFNFKELPASGLSSKDYIVPSSFNFGQTRQFHMGGLVGCVSFIQILAPELNDRMLADFMEADEGIIVTLHIQSVDQNEAIKTIKRKITDLDSMKIQEQKKAVRSGYDMDIIPSDLATYGGEAKNLLKELQSRNEKMFLVTFLVMNYAGSKRKLDNAVFQAAGVAQKYNCKLVRLDYQQEGLAISPELIAEAIRSLPEEKQTAEGNVIHYGYIEKFIENLGERFNIREIAFDRWGAVQMVQNLEGMGFTVVPFGQGFKDMSPPTKELMKLTLEKKLAHGGHPVLRWMMDNIFIRQDPAGNIKADKEKSTEKIDGAIATIMALDRAIRCGNESHESVYDSRGILFL